ncbi:MAG: potassium transporter [Methanoregula sp. PtaU1.Bin051]|nr:MAG: potassium transporter [Methanoregula sp. PtaU1.Bin051]
MKRHLYLSTILADVGEPLLFVSPLTCIPLVVAILFGEWKILPSMASVPVIFLLLGLALKRLPKSGQEKRLSAAMCSVALFWLICAAVSGIPFVFGVHMSVTDSLFEGMAGWTSTAFSMARDLDTMPFTLLFWRSYMQWIGGIAIVAFSIAMASSTGLFTTKMLRSESRDEPPMHGVITAGRALYGIYALLTFIAIGLILFTGLSLWDSVNLAMTTISTGGFTVHSQGIIYYQNILLELVLIPIMIAGALPFKLYFLILQNRKWSFFGDEQVKLFFIILAAGVAFLTFDQVYFENTDVLIALGQGLFMATSALTTTGFQIARPDAWAGVTLLFLTMLVFIGGSAGSTAGGIKLNRVALAYRGMLWWFKRAFVSAKVIVPLRIEGKVIPRATAEIEMAKNMLVIILSVVIVFISTLLVLQFHITSFSISEVLFDTISALSTCGLTTGYVSYDMPVLSKWIFIGMMWVGRLEVIPVMMLIIALIRDPE